jgi:twinkle protein
MVTLQEWLESRGLDLEIADKMGWVQRSHAQLGASVAIPYVKDGKRVATQYRALETKDFRFSKDCEVELWNVDCLKDRSLDSQPLIMAEGACDGLAIMQAGFQRVIAVPGWSDKNFEAANYKPFTSNEELIKRAGTIIVAQHNDNAGATMLRAVANFFDECNVKYVTWPKDCKDANDCLLLKGQESLVTAISSARAVDPEGGLITGFSDLPPSPSREIWKLGIPAFPELDKVMAFRSRSISIFTGRPGDGKTTFMTWATHHLVKNHGLRVGLALFETDADEVLTHLGKLEGKEASLCSPDEWAKFKQELDQSYRIMHRVEGKDITHGTLWLKAMIHKLAARDHCQIIIIDPWNELEHLYEKGETVTQYINLALTKMRQWAEKYNIHICIVAHPRKMMGNDRPDGYSISDSAAWMNKCDTGWTVSIEPERGYEVNGQKFVDPAHVRLSCWKVRARQQTGCRPGAVDLKFDEDSMVYRKKG